MRAAKTNREKTPLQPFFPVSMAEGLGIQHLFAASYNGADFPVKVLALSHPYTENKILPPYIVILIKKKNMLKLS